MALHLWLPIGTKINRNFEWFPWKKDCTQKQIKLFERRSPLVISLMNEAVIKKQKISSV